jgi:hypothetical protein
VLLQVIRVITLGRALSCGRDGPYFRTPGVGNTERTFVHDAFLGLTNPEHVLCRRFCQRILTLGLLGTSPALAASHAAFSTSASSQPQLLSSTTSSTMTTRPRSRVPCHRHKWLSSLVLLAGLYSGHCIRTLTMELPL